MDNRVYFGHITQMEDLKISPQKETIIYNVEIAKTSTNMSGGETCLVELVKIWSKQYKNFIVTPENGTIAYSQLGLKGVTFVEIGKYWLEKKFGVFLSYITRTVISLFKIKKLPNSLNNVIVSHSDFWPTVIYAHLLKRRNSRAKWIAINHMLAPHPCKGFRYQFTNKYILPTPSSLHYWLNQKLFFILQKRADVLVYTNSSYREIFRKYNKNLVFIQYASDFKDYEKQLIECGGDAKIYDACFMGRFHVQKGIFELLDVVKHVVKERGAFRCAVVGDFNNSIGVEFIKKVRAMGLQEHIIFLGPKFGLEKYKVLKQARVFFFPSYYESFGIVYLEAISVGLPVVEYDLPIYQDHKYGVVKVPFLNREKFAERTLELLKNQPLYEKLSQEGQTYASSMSWDNAASIIANYF